MTVTGQFKVGDRVRHTRRDFYGVVIKVRQGSYEVKREDTDGTWLSYECYLELAEPEILT